MSLSYLILQLSIWSVVLPLVAGFLFFKSLDEPSRILFYVVILATIPQLLTVQMIHTKDLNVVYNAYTLIEFPLIYFLLGNKFQRKFFRYASKTIVILFFTLSALLIARFGLRDKFLNELVCAANTAYLAWIFMLILENVLNDQKLMNPRLPIFWFISGLLLYTPCTILIFAFTYYIGKSTTPFIHNLWSIQGVFNTIMYVFFAIGFYKSHILMKQKSVER